MRSVFSNWVLRSCYFHTYEGLAQNADIMANGEICQFFSDDDFNASSPVCMI